MPTIDEIRKALNGMPTGTMLQRRDRALVAFALLSAARDNAIAGHDKTETLGVVANK